MIAILISVLVISLIGAVLAAILVLSESVIANYGICKIDINDGEKEFEVEGGDSLLSSLITQEVFIPSACGGKGTCGYCKVKVLEGGGPLLPTETPFLTDEETDDNVRLSCQIKVKEDIKIHIPSELLSVKQYTAKCTKITDLTYDIKQFRFELPEGEEIDYVPGQYIQLMAPQYPGNDEEVYRAYSISSDPKDKTSIELIIRKVPNGICTTWCFEHLKEGDEVVFNGPYGDFYLRDTDAPIVFIAGGSGMAPIKCLLHHMKNENINRKACYFFGGRNPEDQYCMELMKQFEKDLEDFEYIPVVGEDSSDWDGETGLVTEALLRKFDKFPEAEGYLCGSPGMINASKEALMKIGVPEEKIYYDSFE